MKKDSHLGYTKWRIANRKVLRDMYEDFCQFQNITFEQYCRQTYESLKQTGTFNEDFGLGVSIDLV